MDYRIILHIDMDAFFVSVEQRDCPSLKGKLAAVCGSLSRSVVTSATYEARTYGIRAGMPVQEAKRRCPQLTLVEGTYSEYTETDRKNMKSFLNFSGRNSSTTGGTFISTS